MTESQGEIEATQSEASLSSQGSSRRKALKLGAAAGVGAVAWSGMTITSLGGTPAYAAGCTFVVKLDLSGGCRNTEQASGADFGYQPLKATGYPTGYSITNNIAAKTACNAGAVANFNFPAGITCKVVIQFRAPSKCSGPSQGALVYGPSPTSPIQIAFTCVTPAFPSSTQYTITATCNTTGAPPECLN